MTSMRETDKRLGHAPRVLTGVMNMSSMRETDEQLAQRINDLIAANMITHAHVLTGVMNMLRNPDQYDPISREENALLLGHMLTEHHCFARAGIGEPLFTLRAKDRLSTRVIKKWIKWARRNGAFRDKLDSAEAVRRQMKSFPGRKMPS